MASEWDYRFPGYEQWVWEALAALAPPERGREAVLQVLSLIHFKYVYDRFAQCYYTLLAEGAGQEEMPAAYTAAGYCFVPKPARWNEIFSAEEAQKGEVLAAGMRAVAEGNPHLAGLWPKDFSSLDGAALALVVERLNYVRMAEPAQRCALDRDCFSFALDRFAGADRLPAGRKGTPDSLARFVAAAMQIHGGSLYDPCCGTGALCLRAAEYAMESGGERVFVTGGEQDPVLRKIARMNLSIHGVDAEVGGARLPAFTAGYAVADLLLNKRKKAGRRTPPGGWEEQVWIELALEHLGPGGRLGVLLSDHVTAASRLSAGSFCRKLVEEDLAEVVIRLPAGLYSEPGAAAALWILSGDKAVKGRTLFIDASSMGSMESRRRRSMTTADIAGIAALCRDFYAGRMPDGSDICAVVSAEAIARQRYSLAPECYIGTGCPGCGFAPGSCIGAGKAAEEPLSLEERMKNLTGELAVLLSQSQTMESNMRRMLEAIGYEI